MYKKAWRNEQSCCFANLNLSVFGFGFVPFCFFCFFSFLFFCRSRYCRRSCGLISALLLSHFSSLLNCEKKRIPSLIIPERKNINNENTRGLCLLIKTGFLVVELLSVLWSTPTEKWMSIMCCWLGHLFNYQFVFHLEVQTIMNWRSLTLCGVFQVF